MPEKINDQYIADKRYIDESLADLKDQVLNLSKQIAELDKRLSVFQGKAAVIGALAGTAMTLAVKYLSSFVG